MQKRRLSSERLNLLFVYYVITTNPTLALPKPEEGTVTGRIQFVDRRKNCILPFTVPSLRVPIGRGGLGWGSAYLLTTGKKTFCVASTFFTMMMAVLFGFVASW